METFVSTRPKGISFMVGFIDRRRVLEECMLFSSFYIKSWEFSICYGSKKSVTVAYKVQDDKR
jgi:hypothetical protein